MLNHNQEAWKNYYARWICRYNFQEVNEANVKQVKKEFLNSKILLEDYVRKHTIAKAIRDNMVISEPEDCY